MMGMTSFFGKVEVKRITLKLKSSILMVSEIDVWRGFVFVKLPSVIKD